MNLFLKALACLSVFCKKTIRMIKVLTIKLKKTIINTYKESPLLPREVTKDNWRLEWLRSWYKTHWCSKKESCEKHQEPTSAWSEWWMWTKQKRLYYTWCVSSELMGQTITMSIPFKTHQCQCRFFLRFNDILVLTELLLPCKPFYSVNATKYLLNTGYLWRYQDIDTFHINPGRAPQNVTKPLWYWNVEVREYYVEMLCS